MVAVLMSTYIAISTKRVGVPPSFFKFCKLPITAFNPSILSRSRT